MKWNGTVSHSPVSGIATKLSAANATQASSTARLRSMEGNAYIPDGLDQLGPELRTEPAHVDVHDVGSRVEGVAPHLAEQLLARADLLPVADEVLEEQELAGRECRARVTRVHGPMAEVDDQPAGVQEPLAVRGALPQAPAHAGEQLDQRERLRHVVGRTEVEAAQLRV